MTTSITASTVSPFTGLLLQDSNYNASASFPAAGGTVGATPSVYYPNVDYPTVGKFIVQVYNTAVTNTSSSATISMSLQHSADNSTWVNIPQFAASLLSFTDAGSAGATGGSAVAGTTQVLLPPNVNPYVRVVTSVPTGGSTSGGLTGSLWYPNTLLIKRDKDSKRMDEETFIHPLFHIMICKSYSKENNLCQISQRQSQLTLRC